LAGCSPSPARLTAEPGRQLKNEQQRNGRKLQTHFVYLLAKALFSTKIPLAFILISVVASWRDLGHIPSFIATEAAAKELRR
jgi:hypothetical protein